MKNLFLGTVLLLLGIFCLIMFMAMPAKATPIKDLHPDMIELEKDLVKPMGFFDPVDISKPIDNCELLPIDPMLPWAEWCWVQPENGPTWVTFGKNVWVNLNKLEWVRMIGSGNAGDFTYWNTNIFYRYFDNAKYEFYYISYGNEHSDEYPQRPPAQTPLPPSFLLLGSGLVGLVGLRRKAR